MKILKKANQKNFIVDQTYYTENDLKYMLTCEQFKGWDDEIRVFTCFCSEVKMKLDEHGLYCAVVVLKETGEEIHVVV